MLDSLFNMQLPLPVKLLVAFGIVLVLLAAVMWIFRRLSGNRLGTTPARGRQPRLAVIDAAAVDARRRLVLIRRDNVEHLVMIGGPSDVLIEQNIVRAVPVAPREAPAREPMPRAPAEPMPRASAEPVRQPSELPPPRPARQQEPPRAPRPEAMARRPVVERPERPRDPPPGFPPRASADAGRAPRMPPPVRVEPERAPELHAAPPTSDPNLADMAHKLEAALRRPSAARRPDAPPPALNEPPPPTAPEINGNGSPSPRAEAPPVVAARPAAEAAKKPDPNASKSLFDSLEEEMASLLNRPPDAPPEKK